MDFVRISLVVVFKSLGLMYLTLDGRHIRRTARKFFLPRREFSIAAEHHAFDMMIAAQVP